MSHSCGHLRPSGTHNGSPEGNPTLKTTIRASRPGALGLVRTTLQYGPKSDGQTHAHTPTTRIIIIFTECTKSAQKVRAQKEEVEAQASLQRIHYHTPDQPPRWWLVGAQGPSARQRWWPRPRPRCPRPPCSSSRPPPTHWTRLYRLHSPFFATGSPATATAKSENGGVERGVQVHG